MDDSDTTANSQPDMDDSDTTANSQPDINDSDTTANSQPDINDNDTTANSQPDMDDSDTTANSQPDINDSDTTANSQPDINDSEGVFYSSQVALRRAIKRVPLCRKRTLAYAVLLSGLVTCIGICALGESLMVKPSVTTRRLAYYDGQVRRSLAESAPASTGHSYGDGHKTSNVFSAGAIKGGKARDVFVQSASSSLSNTQVSFKNLSSKVIGDRETLTTGSSDRESAFIVVKNERSHKGMVAPHRADNAENTMASKLNTTAATRSGSVGRNKTMNSASPITGYGSTITDVKQQEDHVEDDRKESTDSAPFQHYLTNLSDTSFYDNQIKVVMETKDACADASLYDAVMTVHSSPANTQKRRAFRWLYGDQEQTHSYKIKVIFLVGLVTNRTLQRSLELENHLHNDIVQGNFLDTYRNLTYKAVFGFHWVATRCKGLRLLLRLDDDVFLATDRFFSTWHQRNTTTNTIGAKAVLCDLLKNDVVRRAGKWRVPETLVAASKYTFPHCLGYFAAMTPGLVRDVSEVSRRTPFFWIDDVFIYGFVMNKIRGVDFLPAKDGSLRKKHAQFERCLLAEGPRGCPSWVVVGDPRSFKKLYHLFYDDNARDATPTMKSS